MIARRAALIATLAGGAVLGGLYGDPLASAAFAVAIAVAWATAGFSAVLALCVLVLALASSGYADVKETASTQRWLALTTLSLWPLISGVRPRWSLPPAAGAAAAALLILAFGSAWWSLDPALTVSRAVTLAMLVWVGLVVVPTELPRHHDRLAAARALASLGAAGALAALAVGLVDPAMGQPAGAWRGWFENPNTLGLWCALLLSCTIAMRGWRSWAITAAPLVACVVLSDSRSALLVTGLVLFAILPLSLGARAKLAVGAAASWAFLLATPASGLLDDTGLGKFTGSDDPLRAATGARQEGWDATLELVPFAPFEGFGFGLGDQVFALTAADLEFVHFVGNNPNNAYLNALLELGALGLVALLLLLGSLAAAAWQTRERQDRRPFVILAASVLVAGLVESLFTSAGSPFAILLWTGLALAGSRDHVPRRVREHPVALIHATALRPTHDGATRVLTALVQDLPTGWTEAQWVATVRHDVKLNAPGVELIRARRRRSGVLRVIDDLVWLPSLVGRLRPDVVLVPNESVAVRVAAPLVVLAQNAVYHCEAAQPVTAGGAPARLRSRMQFAYHRWQMPRAYSRADHVIAVSEHLASVLTERAGLDPSRTTVVPEGADGLPSCSVQTSRQTIVAVGTLAPYKRLDVALEALELLRREGTAYRLVALGGTWPGTDEELETRAAELGVSDAWRWEGPRPPERVAELLAGAHCLLALSACESVGLPVLEAMRADVPVVAADEPWSRETAGGAALFVPGGDPSAVAAAVRSLEDPELWRSLSTAGRERCSSLRWSTTGTTIAGVLRATANEAAAAGGPARDRRPPKTLLAGRFPRWVAPERTRP